jgi:pilus assembly protein CpaE
MSPAAPLAEMEEPMPLPAAQRECVAVVSAKGGCGATLLSVNLAAEAASAHLSSSVCVLDLDHTKGDVAGFLGLEPQQTVPELVRQLDTMDASLVRGAATPYKGGSFHVLPQPTDLAELATITRGEVSSLLHHARAAFDLLVVDCGSRIDAATLATLVAADAVILVLTPDLPALRDARRLMNLLRRVRIDQSHIRLVLNKVSRHSRLSAQDIEQQLGIPLYAVIHRDEDACVDADLEARLLRDVAPRARITRDIRSVWGALDPDDDEPARQRWRFPWQS